MDDIMNSNHPAKAKKHITFKQRLCLLTKTLKRKTNEEKLIILDKKNENCSESQLSTNESFSSIVVNYDKRQLIKRKPLQRKPFYQKNNISSTYLNSKRVQNTCLDINSIEKLSNNQIASKNLSNIENFDRQKMIDKLVELNNQGNLVYSYDRNAFRSKRNFKLKHIEPITLQLNPLKEFRFMDYVFPLDSSQMHENNENYVSLFSGFDKIKRILKTINNSKKEIFSIYVEDNDPKSIYSTNYCNSNELYYALDWQKSVGYLKAFNYRQTLLNFMIQNTTDNNSEDIHKYNTKMNLCDDGSDKSYLPDSDNGSDKNYLSHEKYYIKSIDKATNDWIKTKPYISKVKKITGNVRVKKCYKVGINYLALNLIKKAPDDSTRKVINILDRFKTVDFYDQMLLRFDKQNYDWDFEGIAIPDAILKNCVYVEKSGQHVKIDQLCYDEKYIKNGIIYVRTRAALINQA